MIESRVVDQFVELEALAKRIRGDFLRVDSRVDFALYTRWELRCKKMLKRVFPDDPEYLELFNKYSPPDPSQFEMDAFLIMHGAFLAAHADYEGGYHLQIRTRLRGEDAEYVLNEAREFLRGNRVEVSCILSGIALDIMTKELSKQKGGDFQSFADRIVFLRDNGVINESDRKHLEAAYGDRSSPAHGKFDEVTPRKARKLIDEADEFGRNHGMIDFHFHDD